MLDLKEKRTVVIIGIIAILILIGYIAVSLANKVTEEEERTYASTTVSMGERISLDSKVDQEDEVNASFDWNGTFEACLLSAKRFDSYSEAGIEESEAFLTLEDTQDLILLELEIKNIDAVPRDENSFSISAFGIFDDSGEREVYYFDGTLDKSDPKKGYHYFLEKGETKKFKIGYAVDEDFQKANGIINAGLTAGVFKYMIELTIDS